MKRKLPIPLLTAPPPFTMHSSSQSRSQPGSTSFKKPLSTLNCQIFRSSESPSDPGKGALVQVLSG